MAYIQPQFFRVSRPDQIIPGEYYLLVGTTSNANMPPAYLKSRKMDTRIRMPPTLVRPLSRVYYTGLGVGQFRVWFYIIPGEWKQKQMREGYAYTSIWSLDEINVPEHGAHDHHLVRVPNGYVACLTEIRNQNRKADYGEVVGYRVGKRGH